MPTAPFQPSLASRRTRPAWPRCRGGVSSVLRLAQPKSNSALGPWIVRAAAGCAPIAAAVDAAERGTAPRLPSIITRLLPSHELAQA